MNSRALLLMLTVLFVKTVYALPEGFVYLHDLVPFIQQDMRYFGDHNFMGRPIKGYHAGRCILTAPAASALLKVQSTLLQSGLSLKVYDCYRPEMAVADFITWSKDPTLQSMKSEFYPNVDKADFFKLGYVAEKSGHSRGSTVDLTIVPLSTSKVGAYHKGDQLVSCLAPYNKRFHDNSIDMGTGFDCMDPLSHPLNKEVNEVAYAQRMLLRKLMLDNGFTPLEEEWWHFTLKDEPYPKTYFNFPVK